MEVLRPDPAVKTTFSGALGSVLGPLGLGVGAFLTPGSVGVGSEKIFAKVAPEPQLSWALFASASSGAAAWGGSTESTAFLSFSGSESETRVLPLSGQEVNPKKKVERTTG